MVARRRTWLSRGHKTDLSAGEDTPPPHTCGAPARSLLSPGFVPRRHPAPGPLAGHQVLGRRRAPGPAGGGLRMSLGLPGLEQRVDDLPGTLDLLAAGKDRVAAGQNLAQNVLVGVGQLLPSEAAV